MDPRIFSPRVLHLIGEAFSFFKSTRCYPFGWDWEKNTLTLEKSRFTRIYSRIYTLVTTFFFLFEIYQLFALCLSETPAVMDIYWVVSYGWGIGANVEGLLVSMWKGEEWIQFFKQAATFDAKFKDLEVFDQSRRIRLAEKIQLFNTGVNILAGISVFICAHIIYLAKADAPQYVYNIYPDHQNWTPYFFFLILELYTKGIIIFWFFVVVAWCLAAIVLELTALNFLRKSKTSLKTKIQFYKSLFILNQMHNKCYFSTTIPLRLSLFGFFIVQNVVVIVRLRDKIRFIELILAVQFFVGFLTAAILFLHISGTLLKNSGAILDKMMISVVELDGGKRKVRYVGRVVKSLQPFGVKSSPNRVINFGGMLQYFVMVISGITTVLVSLNA